MSCHGPEPVDLFKATGARRPLLAISHSGGKDSQALLIRVRALYPALPMVVVHAALGEIEWPGALEHARGQADRYGLPFIVATAKRSLFQMVEDRAQRRPDVPSWPSSSTRQCTSDLKRGPIERELRRYADTHGHDCVINCMGFRAEESPARARRPVLARRAKQCNSKRTWFDFLPILGMGLAEVWEVIAGAGERPHWAYSAGNQRLSCMFCIMGSANDLRNAARHAPALLAQYVELEERTGYTMHMSGRALAEICEA